MSPLKVTVGVSWMHWGKFSVEKNLEWIYDGVILCKCLAALPIAYFLELHYLEEFAACEK